MNDKVYVDLEVVAEVGQDEYLIKVSKEDLNSLVTFDGNLVLRHWDGEKPVRLLAYGSDSIRTEEDASEGNNLSNLPHFHENFQLKV